MKSILIKSFITSQISFLILTISSLSEMSFDFNRYVFFNLDNFILTVGITILVFCLLYFSLKTILKSIFIVMVLNLFYLLYLEYDNYQYKKLENELRDENKYNGKYTFDINKIKSKHILKDIKMASKYNQSAFILNIDGTRSTIYGRQTNQPIRMRTYNVCLKDKGLVLLNGFYDGSKYCEINKGKDLELLFEEANGEKNKLECKECEKYGFPSSWIKQ